MRYYEHDKPCLTYEEFVLPTGLIPKGTFDSLKARKHIKVLATGGNGRVVEICYNSLPEKYKELVIKKYGEPTNYIATQPLLNLLEVDKEAKDYYASYELPDGRNLPIEYQVKYARQCDWFKLITKCLADKRTLKDTLRISIEDYWNNVSLLINNDKEPHGLPTSVDRLRRAYNKYKNGGYGAIVEAYRFGNDHARIVNKQIENLVLSLYCQPNRPYLRDVCRDYAKFINGELQVIDMQTGEVFDPKDFYVDGKPYELGENTVHYYIKKPVNEAVVDKYRLSALQYANKHKPHAMRKPPLFAFSKITMDDLDIPFKTPEGDRAVKSYQVYDVASGAIIGVAFSRDKTVELVKDALRDMLRLVMRNGWGIPWQIEVEQHLNSTLKGKKQDDGTIQDDILTEGNVFPFVRFCRGANPQEKRAEGFIRRKKYGQQKNREGFQGRHYARNEANRLNKDRDKVRYLYEEIIQNELEDIAAHNNSLHHDQDTYPNMTRWQVLEQCQNPNSVRYQIHNVIQYFGMSVATSINRTYVQVQYNKYRLPEIADLEAFNNSKVTAYYLPDEMGRIDNVYLFQDGSFVCEAIRVERFNEATVEQTDADRAAMYEQFGYMKDFDRMINERDAAMPAAGVLRNGKKREKVAQPVVVTTEKELQNNPKNGTKDGGYAPENEGKEGKKYDLENIRNLARQAI